MSIQTQSAQWLHLPVHTSLSLDEQEGIVMAKIFLTTSGGNKKERKGIRHDLDSQLIRSETLKLLNHLLAETEP